MDQSGVAVLEQIPTLATALISPLGTALLLLVIGVYVDRLHRRAHVGALLILTGCSWLWVWSMPLASNWLQALAEQSFPPHRAETLSNADAIVVLGGAISPPSRLMPYPNMREATDRLWHAARIFHAGKAQIVLVAGGSDSTAAVPEAEAMRMLLTDLGVPREAILLEARSRTTQENAEFSAAVLRQIDARRIVLVTSALHMERAVLEFQRTGLWIIPAPTDHVQPNGGGLLNWVPDAKALEGSARALKELVGRWIARLSKHEPP